MRKRTRPLDEALALLLLRAPTQVA
jgi:hypothetical protein